MKIGIITMHKVRNFGSVLQAYALQHIIKQLGFDKVMDNLKYCYNKRLENLNNTITNLRKWN